MKVLAAGKSTRPALASAPRCECSGNLGHLAIANGTPARRRHTDTWGVRATGPAAGGAGWRLGRAQAHGPGAARPARPPGGQQVGGQARGAAAFLHLLLLLFLLEPATLPCCSSRSAFSPIHPPSFFLSFFLSFRFLFSNRVLGCSLGGAQAAQQLANSGWDKSRCCLQLLVPGKLCSVLGELGAARVGGSHPRDSALPGDAGRYRGPNRSELEAATLSRETPVPSSPQPRWFPSLSGPLTPALTAEPPGKTPLRTAMGEGGMGKQARWGRGDPGPE